MRGRTAKILTCAVAVALTATGCSSVEISPPISSCSPDYRVNSGYGNFSIQQSGKGRAIQWGAYPNATYSGTEYVADVYTGGRRYDHKSQNYAPHGSVDAGTASKYSGKILQISGNVTRKGKTVLVYNMQCTIA